MRTVPSQKTPAAGGRSFLRTPYAGFNISSDEAQGSNLSR
jgi:hypothetical protein